MAEEVMLINPRKRTRRRKTGATRKRRRTTARRNPAPRRRRRSPARKARRRTTRVRRNPSPRGIMGKVNQSFMPAVQGAGGALGLDLLMGYLPLPSAVSTGVARHLVKGVGAVAMGYVASMVVKPKTAQQMMQGALTVTLHDAAKEQIQTMLPEVNMGGMGYVSPAYTYSGDLSAYLDQESSGYPALNYDGGDNMGSMDAYIYQDEDYSVV